MRYGEITANIDVAQLVLYAFWLFFAGLIYYLRREDHREGYPMVGDTDGHIVNGFPPLPTPKKFLLADGSVILAPRPQAPEVFAAKRAMTWVGAPFQPTGNPMVDGVGPASWARRHDEPDLAYDDGLPKIVPLRNAADFYLSMEDYDPRGYEVVAMDRVAVGKVVDAWIDRSEYIVRYLEVELYDTIAPRHVMLPMNFAKFQNKQMIVKVGSIASTQFAEVPALRQPDVITFLEEDKVTGYYAGGLMYASASRMGPLL
jgi:photosynthetic reaction center H subunit